ncbi:MAG: hypothetical protein QOH32_4060, partial [Bradyrhizobium sp.]|nr:hypothetical protein [Bradyrhizobium sp.]
MRRSRPCVALLRLSSAQPNPGAQELLRIDGLAIDPGLVMQVRSGRAAGRADR